MRPLIDRSTLARTFAVGTVLFGLVFYTLGAALKPGYSSASQFISELNAAGTTWAQQLGFFGFVPLGLLFGAFLLTAGPLAGVRGASRVGWWLLWSQPLTLVVGRLRLPGASQPAGRPGVLRHGPGLGPAVFRPAPGDCPALPAQFPAVGWRSVRARVRGDAVAGCGAGPRGASAHRRCIPRRLVTTDCVADRPAARADRASQRDTGALTCAPGRSDGSLRQAAGPCSSRACGAAPCTKMVQCPLQRPFRLTSKR